jgi:hypothetical protein
MVKRDTFLLRVDPVVLEAIRRWADDEVRSVNAQIDFILRSKLWDAGRLPPKSNSSESDVDSNERGKPMSPG